MYTVHYRDRRTNRRAVYTETSLKWQGPFNYADGNWSADCNRSREMYPVEPILHVECSSAKPVLVVEKIVLVAGGKVVYHDEGISEGVDSDAADMADARLFGAYSAVSGLQGGLMERDVDWPERIDVAQYALKLLEECPQHAGVKPIIEAAIAAAQNVYKMDVCMNLRWQTDLDTLDRCDAQMLEAYKATQKKA